MYFNWLWIYILPIGMAVVVGLIDLLARRLVRRTGDKRILSTLWHILIWLLILSHLLTRAYLLWVDTYFGASIIGLEILVSILGGGVWHSLHKKYLRPTPLEFYEADLVLKWTQLCTEILPKKSIPLFQTSNRILPHTRGCENPVFCISFDLLDTLSDTGQRYIMAHYLFHIKCRHHQFKRLFNFSFALMWYNPLLHVINMMLQRDFDEVSDFLTIHHFGKNHAGSYGMTLIHTYDLHGPEHPLLSMLYRRVGTNHLKERIARLNY